ncbi:MAG: hypothetical protein AVO38_15700 [delta proteobacterium ML8_D]|nr:MAG: hypothetical protein AVO38_15700 [delta proteobacterium ML8_D]
MMIQRTPFLKIESGVCCFDVLKNIARSPFLLKFDNDRSTATLNVLSGLSKQTRWSFYTPPASCELG